MKMVRDEKGNLVWPNFVSDLPEHLLKNSSPAEIHIMNQQSITRQQNEWLIEVALHSDARHHKAERALKDIQTLRLLLAGKWSVVATIISLILIPGGLLLLGVWLEKHFGVNVGETLKR